MNKTNFTEVRLLCLPARGTTSMLLVSTTPRSMIMFSNVNAHFVQREGRVIQISFNFQIVACNTSQHLFSQRTADGLLHLPIYLSVINIIVTVVMNWEL